MSTSCMSLSLTRFRLHSDSRSMPHQNYCPECIQALFLCSLYAWKYKEISFSTQPVSLQKNQNERESLKHVSRIWPGVASPSFSLLGCVLCWSPSRIRPRVLHSRDPCIFISRQYIRVQILTQIHLVKRCVIDHRSVESHLHSRYS